MNIHPIKTRRVEAGAIDLMSLIDEHIPTLTEHSVLAITSKIVSLCEGRVVSADSIPKAALIAREADRYLPTTLPHGIHLTITKRTFVSSAGIDMSNGGGDYILWPRDPQETANAVRAYLCKKYTLKNIGVIITDSTCTPLRRGASGICLAHSGFVATRSYVGEPDLFGRPFAVSYSNIAGGLAASAVLAMGEGSEQTPFCLIQGAAIEYQASDPTRAQLDEYYITADEDIFAPLIDSADWLQGDSGG